MTKNESKLLSLQGIAKASAFCLLLSAFSVNAAMAAPAPAGTVDEVMAVQQGKKVTGVVVDGTGEPVIGANVVVKGTTNGTITDFDGNYSLEGVSANDILVVSYIGYLSQEIPVENQSSIKVTLKEDTQTLDEVVVVGYGTMRKSDVTGSIGVAKGDDLTKNQNFSALDNLRGKVSGVNIFSNSSQPGAYSNRVVIRGMATINALSTRNDSPETASRPFSASRDGFVMGEGGGCLILEELEHAKARGAKIYAEVAGVGMSADAHHLTASHPEGLGAKLVMLNALEDAEMDPKAVDYINVHGTSTPVGDISEAKAIKEVFGDHAFELNISSTKSMTGHLLGAAGAVESIASILAIKNGIVPPTINHEEGDNDENIDYNLNFTFNKAQKREVNVALSNTFGFGGHNACVIFKKYAE